MFDAVSTFCRLQFKRHLKSPMLWVVALAAPIAAKYMVPEQTDGYTVLAINNAYPILTPSVIGMELGIISALLLSPLVYIFLRVGRIKHTPWQIEDVTPALRSKQMLGHWFADTAILWLLLFGLAVSGIILSAFRLSLSEVRPHETIAALMLIACPAFAFIAAIRLYFSARPWLRGALGDVVFFIIWIAAIIIGGVTVEGGGTSLSDLFGYAASMKEVVDVPIRSFVVGSSPGTSNETITIHALRGVMAAEFLISRLFWIVMAIILAVFAGLVFKGRKPKASRRASLFSVFDRASLMAEKVMASALPKNMIATAPLWTHVKQILRPGILIVVLMVVGIAGLVVPFRGAIGPGIWLLALFPLTHHSGLWRNRSLLAYTETLPASYKSQIFWQCLAGGFVLLIVCLPSLLRIFLSGEINQLPDIAFIVFGLPLIITGLGRLTHSGIAARLLLLIAWYMYLNM